MTDIIAVINALRELAEGKTPSLQPETWEAMADVVEDLESNHADLEDRLQRIERVAEDLAGNVKDIQGALHG